MVMTGGWFVIVLPALLFFTSPSTWEVANGMIFLGVWQAAFCPKWPPPASSNPKMCVARRGVGFRSPKILWQGPCSLEGW